MVIGVGPKSNRDDMEFSKELIKEALQSDFWKWYSAEIEALMVGAQRDLLHGNMDERNTHRYSRMQGMYQALYKALHLPEDEIRDIDNILER